MLMDNLQLPYSSTPFSRGPRIAITSIEDEENSSMHTPGQSCEGNLPSPQIGEACSSTEHNNNYYGSSSGVELLSDCDGEEDDVNGEMVQRGVKTGVRKTTSYKKAIASSNYDYAAGFLTNNLLHPIHAETGYSSQSNMWKSQPDWTESAVVGEHIWVDTNASGDFCYVTEVECQKTGPKKKCTACKIIIHIACYPKLEKINFRCKPTFREAGMRNYRDGNAGELIMRHHWVHKRRQEGKCKQCGKSFQQKFPFNLKEVIAIGCTWCKTAYHNKGACFMMQQFSEECPLGVHASIIVPPSWIIKMPRKNSFKSSVRKRGHKASTKRRKSTTPGGPGGKCTSSHFVIKPVPSAHLRPILVFVNPRSGGNQGAKLLHKFQWLLNPRQVFDLSVGGPKQGLELFRKVPNLRMLVCGGDGTVGWVLSTIDSLGIVPFPPIAILPLGTGNDLARTTQWGPGYTDEPLSKVLSVVEESKVILLDRWDLIVEQNMSSSAEDLDKEVPNSLPLNVFNNYFSLGADAAAALEFHESREAKPAKFNSRFRNKIFYAGVGGKDLLKRSWRDLCDYITLQCDGIDWTSKIREGRFHCLLFLNITRYSAGTMPWGNPNCGLYEPQKMDDGYLEIIGFTSTSLATLQMGGHGERICQCRQACLTTNKSIPVQVDGEPCRMPPSKLTISLRNQARLLQKPKRRPSVSLVNEDSGDYGFCSQSMIPERLRIQVSVISMSDYEEMVFDKEILRHNSYPLGIIVVENDSSLDAVRQNVDRLAESTPLISNSVQRNLSNNWIFLDSTTSERFFRIDRPTEALHYITDISSEDLYILDADFRCPSTASTIPHLFTHRHSINPVTDFTFQGPCENNGRPQFLIHTSPSLDQLSSLNKRPIDQIELGISSQCSLSDMNNRLPNSESGPNLNLLSAVMDKRLQQRRASFVDALNKSFLDACRCGQITKVRELVNDGADLSHMDSNGMSCLHHAARFGHKEVIKFLLEHATQELIDMKDGEKGQTALHKAAWYRRRMICRLLVSAGACLTVVDDSGATAKQKASQADDKELASYLESQEHINRIRTAEHETMV